MAASRSTASSRRDAAHGQKSAGEKHAGQKSAGEHLAQPHAKIVCTLGPACHETPVLREMIEAGMNVARINMSHGFLAEKREWVSGLRRAAVETGRIVAVMADLQGPKIRVRRFAKGSVELKSGQRFTITTRNVLGSEDMVSTSYGGLPRDLKPGDDLLLDDGMIQLRVQAIEGEEVCSEVIIGGILSDNKGINAPGAALSVGALTTKDEVDLDFALQIGVDFVALSFVREAADIHHLRRLIVAKGKNTPIVAKIEKPQALENLSEIIAASDAVMVARGDLGVELPAEEIPLVQKDIIAACNRRGIAVITATQMLESMIHNPRPTRAEASDVANAVLDGSDAVMLSGESAVGRYPVEAVSVMRRIVQAAEAQRAAEPLMPFHTESLADVTQGVAASACVLANQLGASAIASVTLSGSMARKLSRFRPRTPIFAFSQYAPVLRRLMLHWGVQGELMADQGGDIDSAAADVLEHLQKLGYLRSGEHLVLTAGMPFSARSQTNMLRVETAP